MRLLLLWIVCVVATPMLWGQEESSKRNTRSYPPKIQGCEERTYKKVGDVELNLWIFRPDQVKNAPAIVFFFGGGWQNGSPQQFEDQCRQLARRGMVAIAADYRVGSRHQVKPTQCLADARSAIRWVRAHSAEFGIDTNRIAAAGGSAGGHLAACTAFIDGFDEVGEDTSVSATPNALVLFNPALVLAPIEGFKLEGFGTRVPEDRMGTEPVNISPAHHIQANAPPTIIFHGDQDTTVPIASAEVFQRKMKELNNRCELIRYKNQKHGFFNNGKYKEETLSSTESFLESLGWLKPKS